FLYIYNELKSKYRNPTVNTFLDKQFLNFYRKNIVTYFKNGERIDSIVTYLSVAANHLQSKNLEKYDYFLKRELRNLVEGNKKGYKRINRQHHFLRDLRAGFKSKEKFYNFLYKHFFTKLKKKQSYVFFESFQGKSFSDSPKAIYEYMRKYHP